MNKASRLSPQAAVATDSNYYYGIENGNQLPMTWAIKHEWCFGLGNENGFKIYSLMPVLEPQGSQGVKDYALDQYVSRQYVCSMYQGSVVKLPLGTALGSAFPTPNPNFNFNQLNVFGFVVLS